MNLKQSRSQNKMLTLREKIIYTVLILIGFRFLSHVPLPFVNPKYISSMISNNGSLTFFNALTGGGFEQMSLMALGITPYISASIVVQLMGVVIPKLADMQKDGATGQKQIKKINIGLSVVLAFVQSICMTWRFGSQGLLTSYTWYTVLIPAVLMTVGVFILAYAGQMIEKHFFGNGISLILLVGILSSYFADANTLYDAIKVDGSVQKTVIACAIAVIAVIALFWFAFFLNSCEKDVHVTYSQKVSANGGASSQHATIPLKLLSGSVVPIIFASSIITLPALIEGFTGSDIKWLWIFNSTKWFNKDCPWATIGVLLYCVMIVGFSYYYNHLNLNELELAQNLQRYGGYINGVRPGKATANYLKRQMKYMTFFGGLGLCVIAIVPTIATSLLNISRLSFLGTSIIITVSVVCESKAKFIAEYDAYGLYGKLSVGSAASRSLFSASTRKARHSVKGAK